MHPEGASNCPWGNHRALLRFTFKREPTYACKSMIASVLLDLALAEHPLGNGANEQVCRKRKR